MNYYRGPRPFAHFDLYRIHTEGDLAAAGFYDYLDMGAVVACEWSENCAELLDLENPLRIHIERWTRRRGRSRLGKSLCGCRGPASSTTRERAAAARLRRHEGMPPYALLSTGCRGGVPSPRRDRAIANPFTGNRSTLALIRPRAGPQAPSVSALKAASPAVALRHAPAGAAPRGRLYTLLHF